MKARWKPHNGIFLVCIVLCVVYVHLYVTEAPIPYPIPEQCQRLPSTTLRNDAMTDEQRQQLRKSVKECFPQEFTFLVYKDDDVGTSNMKFKQGFSVAEYLFSLATNTGTPTHSISKRDFHQIDLQRDCAIIGNGGILDGSRCGTSINRHDFVIRSNLAPIEGYEADVGVKANVTVLNSQIVNQVIDTVDQSNGVMADTFLGRIKYLNDSILWYSKDTRIKFKSSDKLQALGRLLKEKYNLGIRFAYSWRSVGPLTKWFWDIDVPHPTTGLNMFTVAASLCDKITLYGFYPFMEDPRGNPLRYHYYDRTKGGNIGVHNMPREYEMLKKLNQSGVLTLVLDCGQ